MQKRLTPKHLTYDLMNILAPYEKRLIELSNNNGIKDMHLFLQADLQIEVALKADAICINQEIRHVLFEYGFRLFSNLDEADDLVYNDEMTFYELVAFLTSTVKSNDYDMTLYHMINGDYLKVLNQFKKLMLDTNEMSNHLIFNVYQSALNNIMTHCQQEVTLTTAFNHMKRLVRKERPLKSLQIDTSFQLKCPYCKTILLDSNQNYCHQCAQKLSHL